MAMSIECAIFSIGVIVQVTAFTVWEQVMIGRLISGLGVGGLLCLSLPQAFDLIKPNSPLDRGAGLPVRNSSKGSQRFYGGACELMLFPE